MKMKITTEQSNFLVDLLSETGFEIWNAGCTHRLRIDSNGEFSVHPYHNPLNALKTYKSAQAAINFMIKKDEE